MEKTVRIVLLIFVLFNSCNMPEPRPFDRYVDEIISSFAKDMKKEYGLVCVGSGGVMPNDVEEITLIFHAYQHATIEEARRLFFEVTQKFLNKINSNEKIKPFLREYPFTFKNSDPKFSWCRAHIYISFQQKEGTYYLDESVASVSQGKEGKIYYSKAVLYDYMTKKYPNKIEKETKLVPLFEESLEESLKRIVTVQR